jgi:putative DNA primase/helicase
MSATDFNDMAALSGLDAVRRVIANAREVDRVSHQPSTDNATAAVLEGQVWPDPLPVPSMLLPVEAFDVNLLPLAIRAWVADIAERMQCPPDFPAVGAMVALSSVIGRKACIAPKRHDDWRVIPNLWGVVVGRPGVMKSPALSEVMRPLDRMAVAAGEAFDKAQAAAKVTEKLSVLEGKANEAKAASLVKQGKIAEAERVLADAAEADGAAAPALRRYKVTDASVEALGEILIENPFGTLAYRDELNGLLRSLDKEGQEGARAFYLQGYDGNQGYTFDRILRGRNRRIPAVCIAMLGGIQPGKLEAYIRDAVSGGAGDDGLLQRFGLLVWPDVASEWRNVDRFPDTPARRDAFDVFLRLDLLEPATDPETGEACPVEYRFAADAQILFEEWRAEFEPRIRSDEYHPAMQSHLAKYRKLVPAVALVCALVDGESDVSHTSLSRALAWAEYLQSHAERAYAAGTAPATEGAAALLAKIRGGKLEDGFSLRTLYLKGWAHLGVPEAARAAALFLCELGHLRLIVESVGLNGGRPSETYAINPKTMKGT